LTTYAPSFSPRWRGKYVAAGVQHTIQLRKFRGATFSQVSDLSAVASVLFTNWATKLASDFAWLSAECALTDSDVFIPLPMPPAVVGVVNPVEFTPIQKITQVTHSGRAPGSKARFTMFGIFIEQSNSADDTTTIAYNGSITNAEFAGVGANKIEADGQLAAGSGQNAVFYSIVTVKPNDHLLKLVRRGTIA